MAAHFFCIDGGLTVANHVKLKSLELAETIYQAIGDRPFTVAELRGIGLILPRQSVGSTLDDLRGGKILESAGEYRRSYATYKAEWRFTEKFVRMMQARSSEATPA
jgi:hypothetical protein